MLRQNGRGLWFKAWNFAQRSGELAAGARVDVAFSLEEDAFNAAQGLPTWSAVLREFRPAAQVREAGA
jgi:single-stranded-DNA-specific exonuclease